MEKPAPVGPIEFDIPKYETIDQEVGTLPCRCFFNQSLNDNNRGRVSLSLRRLAACLRVVKLLDAIGRKDQVQVRDHS